MPIDPSLKEKRRIQKRDAARRQKLLGQVDDVMDDQLLRIQRQFAKTDARIREAVLQTAQDEFNAQIELHRHLGVGGHAGKRCPTLGEIERERD